MREGGEANSVRHVREGLFEEVNFKLRTEMWEWERRVKAKGEKGIHSKQREQCALSRPLGPCPPALPSGEEFGVVEDLKDQCAQDISVTE